MVLEFLGFALEKVLLGLVAMPGEPVRIGLAALGLLVTSYYDLFNRRNIPDGILYAFFLLAVLANAAFFQPDLMAYAAVSAGFLALFGYALYRAGQWGLADVIVVVAIALLVPIHPSWLKLQPNYPFVLSMFIFAFTLFAAYTIAHFGLRLLRQGRAKPDLKYPALLIPYAGLVYLLLNLPVQGLVSPLYIAVLTLTLLASTFYLVYRQPIQDMLARELPLSDVEDGDVVVLEKMDSVLVWQHKIPRLITRGELGRLRKLKIARLWVYAHLPPFLPFLLAGFLLALGASPLLLSAG